MGWNEWVELMKHYMDVESLSIDLHLEGLKKTKNQKKKVYSHRACINFDHCVSK